VVQLVKMGIRSFLIHRVSPKPLGFLVAVSFAIHRFDQHLS